MRSPIIFSFIYLLLLPFPGWHRSLLPIRFYHWLDQAVTIYYDASLGTAELKDFTGDVYAHTGVLTAESSGWQRLEVCKNQLV